MPIETRFKCSLNSDRYLLVGSRVNKKDIILNIMHDGEVIDFLSLDITTAIKLSKTIRTHINIVKGI